MLIAVIGALTVMLILVAGYAPNVMREVQREKEEEMLYRGEQLVTAIWQFRTKVGREPTTLQQLSDGVLTAGNRRMRFLRPSALKDPMAADGKWRVVRYHDPVIQRFLEAYLKSIGQAPNPLLARYTGVLPKGLPGTRGLNTPGVTGAIRAQDARGGVGSVPVTPGLQNMAPPGGVISQTGPSFGAAAPAAFGSAEAQLRGSGVVGANNPTETMDESGNIVRTMLGVVSVSKKKSVRVFYEELEHYNDWPFIFIPELGQQQITNQDARMAILMSPIIFPSDPLSLLMQHMQGRGQMRTTGAPNPNMRAPGAGGQGTNSPPAPPTPGRP